LGRVEERLAVGGEVVGADAVLDARHRRRLAALRGDPPDLRLAVVRRPLLALALPGAEEVDRLAVGAPLDGPVVAAVEGQPPRRAADRRDDPEVGLAVVR